MRPFQRKLTGVPPTTVLTCGPSVDRAPFSVNDQVKPMLRAPDAPRTAELTAPRLDVRLYGTGRDPSRPKPTPPRSLMTERRIERSSAGSESPPPPDATN